jgi:hypothetical protein
MNNSTFKAIAPKVNLTWGFATVALTVGIAFSTNAAAKSITDTEYNFLAKNIELKFTAAKISCDSVSGIAFEKCIAEAESIREASKMELEAKRKIIVSGRPGSNSVRSDAHLESKPINTNSMPVIDKLNPNIEHSRLI